MRKGQALAVHFKADWEAGVIQCQEKGIASIPTIGVSPNVTEP
jgi:hypothetical protein